MATATRVEHRQVSLTQRQWRLILSAWSDATDTDPEIAAVMLKASTLFARMIACWGAHGVWLGRQDHVAELLKWRPLFHLGLTKGGSPRHPLYLPKSVQPVLWKGCGW